MINTADMYWINKPKQFTISENFIEIKTDENTDFWQRTYYLFRNDNAPSLLLKTSDSKFSFVVKTEFDSSHRYDQCGVIIYQDSDNWVKASIEYENEDFQRLGSVVTNNGYSDWATTDITATQKHMYYRLSRRGDDYCIENSFDGITYKQMRILHMVKGCGEINIGVYACSPEKSSFTARFTDLQMQKCKWEEHK